MGLCTSVRKIPGDSYEVPFWVEQVITKEELHRSLQIETTKSRLSMTFARS